MLLPSFETYYNNFPICKSYGPPGEPPPASSEDADAALVEALTRLPVAKAAGEVAKKFGLDRKELYARALALKDA